MSDKISGPQLPQAPAMPKLSTPKPPAKTPASSSDANPAELKPVMEQNKDGASEHEYTEQEAEKITGFPSGEDVTAQSRTLNETHRISFPEGTKMTTGAAYFKGPDDTYSRNQAMMAARSKALLVHAASFGEINYQLTYETVTHLNNAVVVEVITYA